MAFTLVRVEQGGKHIYQGPNADARPGTPPVGSKCYITEGGIEEYFGATAGWVQNHGASGAANVSPQNSSSWIWPNTLKQNFSGTAANVNDNTVVYESNDVSMYDYHEFSIVTAPGANSVEVLVSHDGTNYETVAIQVVDRSLVVGAVVQSLAQLTAIGNYYFEGRFTRFKIQNNGATTGASCAVRGSSSVK